MRARTVGDLRAELAGVPDSTPLRVYVPGPCATFDADGEPVVVFDHNDIDSMAADLERVEVTTGQVILHVDGEEFTDRNAT